MAPAPTPFPSRALPATFSVGRRVTGDAGPASRLLSARWHQAERKGCSIAVPLAGSGWGGGALPAASGGPRAGLGPAQAHGCPFDGASESLRSIRGRLKV